MSKELILNFVQDVIADVSAKKGDVNMIAAAGNVLIDAFTSDIDKAKVERVVGILLSVVDLDSSTNIHIEDVQFLGNEIIKSLKLDDDFDNLIQGIENSAKGLLDIFTRHMDSDSSVHLSSKEIKDFIVIAFDKLIDLPDDLDSAEEIMAAAKKALSELDEISLDDVGGLLKFAKKSLLEIGSYLGEFAQDALEVFDKIYDSIFESSENSAQNPEAEVVYQEITEEPVELQNEIPLGDEVKDEL
jgi:hypothetical protein